MRLIHSDSNTNEAGWTETTTYKKYFLDESTGEVTLVTTVDVDCPYKPAKNCTDKEISRETLSPEQIPPIVREKISQI